MSEISLDANPFFNFSNKKPFAESRALPASQTIASLKQNSVWSAVGNSATNEFQKRLTQLGEMVSNYAEPALIGLAAMVLLTPASTAAIALAALRVLGPPFLMSLGYQGTELLDRGRQLILAKKGTDTSQLAQEIGRSLGALLFDAAPVIAHKLGSKSYSLLCQAAEQLSKAKPLEPFSSIEIDPNEIKKILVFAGVYDHKRLKLPQAIELVAGRRLNFGLEGVDGLIVEYHLRQLSRSLPDGSIKTDFYDFVRTFQNIITNGSYSVTGFRSNFARNAKGDLWGWMNVRLSSSNGTRMLQLKRSSTGSGDDSFEYKFLSDDTAVRKSNAVFGADDAARKARGLARSLFRQSDGKKVSITGDLRKIINTSLEKFLEITIDSKGKMVASDRQHQTVKAFADLRGAGQKRWVI